MNLRHPVLHVRYFVYTTDCNRLQQTATHCNTLLWIFATLYYTCDTLYIFVDYGYIVYICWLWVHCIYLLIMDRLGAWAEYRRFYRALLQKRPIDYGLTFGRFYHLFGVVTQDVLCIAEWLYTTYTTKRYVSFAEYRLFYRALLQKRPTILTMGWMTLSWEDYVQQIPQNYTSLLQNIVSFIGLFRKRDLMTIRARRTVYFWLLLYTSYGARCVSSHSLCIVGSL